jgi:hypothetical protein
MKRCKAEQAKATALRNRLTWIPSLPTKKGTTWLCNFHIHSILEPQKQDLSWWYWGVDKIETLVTLINTMEYVICTRSYYDVSSSWSASTGLVGCRGQERKCYYSLVKSGRERTRWLCLTESERKKMYSFTLNKAWLGRQWCQRNTGASTWIIPDVENNLIPYVDQLYCSPSSAPARPCQRLPPFASDGGAKAKHHEI